MNSNTRTVLWVIAGLLAFIVVIAAIIAAVLLGPTIIAGLNFGGKVATKTGEAVQAGTDKVTSEADKALAAIKAATGPLSSVPAITGSLGVVEMMKRDPKYDGSEVRVLTNQNDWYKPYDSTAKYLVDHMLSEYNSDNSVICVLYLNEWYYFGVVNGEYCLVAYTVRYKGVDVPLLQGDRTTAWEKQSPPISLALMFNQ